MIRIALETDVPAILDIYAPYVLHTTHSFEYEVPSLEEFTARFQQITGQFPWLVWEEQGTILGYVYGSHPFSRAGYAWTASISIYLRPEAQGQGIGRKLCTTLEQLLALQGYQLVYAVITGENTDSIAFHRHMGYAFLAEFPHCAFKFGRSLSVVWMEKRLKAVEIPIIMPINWPSLVQNDGNQKNILANLSLS